MTKTFSLLPVDGVELAVERIDGGFGGAPIIFLHDSLGCITTWREFPAQVAQGMQADALVYDRQGYGRSAPFGPEARDARYMHREADVLVALMDALGIAQAKLFGFSDGGTIALLAAAKYPERFTLLITQGAHVFVEDVTLNGIRAAEREYAKGELPERLRKHHGERTPALFDAWTKTWQAPFFRDWNIVAELGAISCPTLVLQGVDDPYGTEAQVEAIVDAIGPQASKYMVPGAAHTPHKEAPAITLELVLQFAQEHA